MSEKILQDEVLASLDPVMKAFQELQYFLISAVKEAKMSNVTPEEGYGQSKRNPYVKWPISVT
jgi:hypothetical protein